MRVPVFGGSWNGRWVGEEGKAIGQIPFVLVITACSTLRSTTDAQPTSGSVTSSHWDTSEGTLILQTKEDSAWATISTPTGDYRYLAGKKQNNTLTINTFDGAHLFRFSATMTGDSLVNGSFLSGTHYETSFEGVLAADGGEGWKSAKQAYNGAEMELSGVNSVGDTVT